MKTSSRFLFVAVLLLAVTVSHAQYFGRNKPNYEQFDFKVVHTPHFGRYGGNSDDLFPQYLGFPWYVRGLNTNKRQELFLASGRNFSELTGSKILVSGL
jgi:hypothetical protein